MFVHTKCRYCKSDLPKGQNKRKAFCDNVCRTNHRIANRKTPESSPLPIKRREPVMRKSVSVNGVLWIQSPLFGGDEYEAQ